MHTTIPGKGKGKLVKMDHEWLRKVPLSFPGALPLNVFYEAFMETADKWYKARILSCRLARSTP